MANSCPSVDQYYNSGDTSPVGNHSYHVVRPLQHDKWSRGKDGFLVTDIWGAEFGSSIPTSPTISLKHIEERMYLCAYQLNSLTVILLIPVSSVLDGVQGIATVKQQILENVSFCSLFILDWFKIELSGAVLFIPEGLLFVMHNSHQFNTSEQFYYNLLTRM